MQTVKLNVRCCCKPEKVIGVIEVPLTPDIRAFRKHVLHFPSKQIFNGVSNVRHGYAIVSPVNIIEVDSFYEPTQQEMAIKSNDKPVEWWEENIPGFMSGVEVMNPYIRLK